MRLEKSKLCGEIIFFSRLSLRPSQSRYEQPQTEPRSPTAGREMMHAPKPISNYNIHLQANEERVNFQLVSTRGTFEYQHISSRKTRSQKKKGRMKGGLTAIRPGWVRKATASNIGPKWATSLKGRVKARRAIDTHTDRKHAPCGNRDDQVCGRTFTVVRSQQPPVCWFPTICSWDWKKYFRCICESLLPGFDEGQIWKTPTALMEDGQW